MAAEEMLAEVADSQAEAASSSQNGTSHIHNGAPETSPHVRHGALLPTQPFSPELASQIGALANNIFPRAPAQVMAVGELEFGGDTQDAGSQWYRISSTAAALGNGLSAGFMNGVVRSNNSQAAGDEPSLPVAERCTSSSSHRDGAGGPPKTPATTAVGLRRDQDGFFVTPTTVNPATPATATPGAALQGILGVTPKGQGATMTQLFAGTQEFATAMNGDLKSDPIWERPSPGIDFLVDNDAPLAEPSSPPSPSRMVPVHGLVLTSPQQSSPVKDVAVEDTGEIGGREGEVRLGDTSPRISSPVLQRPAKSSTETNRATDGVMHADTSPDPTRNNGLGDGSSSLRRPSGGNDAMFRLKRKFEMQIETAQNVDRQESASSQQGLRSKLCDEFSSSSRDDRHQKPPSSDPGPTPAKRLRANARTTQRILKSLITAPEDVVTISDDGSEDEVQRPRRNRGTFRASRQTRLPSSSQDVPQTSSKETPISTRGSPCNDEGFAEHLVPGSAPRTTQGTEPFFTPKGQPEVEDFIPDSQPQHTTLNERKDDERNSSATEVEAELNQNSSGIEDEGEAAAQGEVVFESSLSKQKLPSDSGAPFQTADDSSAQPAEAEAAQSPTYAGRRVGRSIIPSSPPDLVVDLATVSTANDGEVDAGPAMSSVPLASSRPLSSVPDFEVESPENHHTGRERDNYQEARAPEANGHANSRSTQFQTARSQASNHEAATPPLAEPLSESSSQQSTPRSSIRRLSPGMLTDSQKEGSNLDDENIAYPEISRSEIQTLGGIGDEVSQEANLDISISQTVGNIDVFNEGDNDFMQVMGTKKRSPIRKPLRRAMRTYGAKSPAKNLVARDVNVEQAPPQSRRQQGRQLRNSLLHGLSPQKQAGVANIESRSVSSQLISEPSHRLCRIVKKSTLTRPKACVTAHSRRTELPINSNADDHVSGHTHDATEFTSVGAPSPKMSRKTKDIYDFDPSQSQVVATSSGDTEMEPEHAPAITRAETTPPPADLGSSEVAEPEPVFVTPQKPPISPLSDLSSARRNKRSPSSRRDCAISPTTNSTSLRAITTGLVTWKTGKDSTRATPHPIQVGEKTSEVQIAAANDDLADDQNPRRDSLLTPNRVFAVFKDRKMNYYPATCVCVEENGFRIVYDDGNSQILPETRVRRLQLRKGDIVKVDRPGLRANIYVVLEMKDRLESSAMEGKPALTDAYGYKSVVVALKRRKSLNVENELDGEGSVFPVASVFLAQSMWEAFNDRTFTFTPSPTGTTKLASASASTPWIVTPNEFDKTVSAPPSRSHRKSAINVAYDSDGIVKAPAQNIFAHTTVQRPPVPSTGKAGILANMAFAISFTNSIPGPEDLRSSTEDLIRTHGGLILDEGFHKLFTSDSSPTLSLTPAASTSLTFTALLTNRHSVSTKYFQALALSLPCLHHHWLRDSIAAGTLLSWSRYLLPAGESADLDGAVRSRVLPGPYDSASAKLAQSIASRARPLQDKRIIFVNSHVVAAANDKDRTNSNKKKKTNSKDVSAEKRRTYLFLLLAMGAEKVKMVAGLEEAARTMATCDSDDDDDQVDAREDGDRRGWDWVFVVGDAAAVAVARDVLSCSLPPPPPDAAAGNGNVGDAGKRTWRNGGGGRRRATASTAQTQQQEEDEEEMMIGRRRKVKVVDEGVVKRSLILGELVDA